MPLKGIKVVEFAGLAPGPFCGMVLADFGASVIRIDRANSVSTPDCLSNGKKSLAVDLKAPKGIEIVRKLIRTSDVSIEPFRAGVMEKLGLGPEILMQDNPRLIYARLTGYGQNGPYKNKAGHDINYLAMSGLLSLLGRKHENPIFPINLLADFGGGGLICAMGIVMALFERERSGKGQIIDANMVGGTAYLGSFPYRSQTLPFWGNKRGENILDSGAPCYEVYRTKDDKFMAVGALEPQFYDQLLKGLKLSAEQPPQYSEATKELFTKKFKEKTRDEWSKIFENLDACVTPILELDEASEHSHNVTQNNFIKGDGIYSPNAAPRLSRTPATSKASLKQSRPGEHTIEILEELGWSRENINELEELGVVQTIHNSKL